MSITVKNLHKDLAEDQLHEAKGFTTASNNTYLKKNHEGSSEWLSEYWLQPVLGVVTGASAPPTESSGDRYILTGSSFNAGWDSPSQHEIVEYNGTTWVGIAAVDGMRVVDLSNDSVYYFNTAWNQLTDANTDTTYSISAVDSGDDAIIRLTAGGSGSGTDDVTLVAGSNITLTPSGDNITIASTASGGASALNGLDDVESVAGSSALAFSLFLANGTSPSAAPSHGTLSAASRNFAVLANALGSLTSGDSNIAIGYYAGASLTTESFNTLIGDSAGKLLNGGANACTAIGYAALDAATTGYGNTAIGYNAASAVTLGDFNVCIGAQTGDGLQNADRNIIIGYDSDGAANADHQIVIGDDVDGTQASSLVLGQNGQILLHGDYATAGQTKLGINLGNTFTAPTATIHVKGQGTGTDTALLVEDSAGDDLLKVLDNGSVTVNNAYTLPTAVTGANDYVLTAQTDGTTAWAAVSGGGGASVLNDLTDVKVQASSTSGRYSLFINGATAGAAPQHGTLNNAQANYAIGKDTLKAITTGDFNVGIGFENMTTLTTESNGKGNVTIGYKTGRTLTGEYNVCIGYDAGSNISGGDNIVAIGRGAMGNSAVTNGLSVCVGYNAGNSQTSGQKNVMIGADSGTSDTTGYHNTFVGYDTGDTITEGHFNLFLGSQTDGVLDADYQTAIGYKVATTQAKSLVLGREGVILLHGDYATADETKLGVNLGTTFTAPSATLHVKGQGTTNSTTSLLVENSGGTDIIKATDDGVVEFNGQAYSPTQTLTDGANISLDFNSGNVATVTLAGNRTLDNPSNPKDGGTYIVIVKQDGTGSRTLAYGGNYKWEGGTAPTLSTGANAVDILTFVSDGTNMYGTKAQNFS